MPPTPLPYCNNLRKDDRVMDIKVRRSGVVAFNPMEKSVSVRIRFDGTQNWTAVHLSRLRLLIDGKIAEDVPPCDGELPPEQTRKFRRPGEVVTPADLPKVANSIAPPDSDSVGHMDKLRASLLLARRAVAALEVAIEVLKL